jgi:hypothetical protein
MQYVAFALCSFVRLHKKERAGMLYLMRNYYKYIVFVSWAISLLSADFEFEGSVQFNKQYMFVSLGGNCWQAQALRDMRAYGLRDAAFPFDWLFSFDVDGLIRCLDEHFENFLNEQYFRRYENRSMHIENFYYNFQFTHDWPYGHHDLSVNGFKKQMAFIREKYTRRINRFNNLAQFSGKMFFTRFFATPTAYEGCNRDNARNLYDALRRYFPKLDFTLVVVSAIDEHISEVGAPIPGIIEYKVKSLVDNNFEDYYFMYNDILNTIVPGFQVTNSVPG